ncbi:hypothetical protein [Hyphomicrobium sp. DY-1]|uniref:hypothetical protein n=1 Tax=Hyphomicrobium sp. DY-1 TaxID=3075650 RepID=UPI0039C3EE15
MTTTEVALLVQRVIAGKEGFPPIRFPIDPRASSIVTRHAAVFFLIRPSLTNLQRIAYIRKFALYIARQHISHQLEFDLLFGTQWFSANPSALTSRMGFGHAMRLQKQSNGRLPKNHSADPKLLRSDLNRPYVDAPLLAAFDGYALIQLVHARHLVDVGTAAGNCLKQIIGDELLPNPTYWRDVKSGTLNLYALTHEGRLCLVFAIRDNRITEMETVNAPDTLHAAMRRAADAIEARIGPVTAPFNATSWPRHPAETNPPHPREGRFFMEDPT